MDANNYWIAGFPVVGLFIVLMAVIFSVTLTLYVQSWSKVESKDFPSKDIFQLAAGLAAIGLATAGTLLLTYNFLWTALALVVSGTVVTSMMFVLENREHHNLS